MLIHSNIWEEIITLDWRYVTESRIGQAEAAFQMIKSVLLNIKCQKESNYKSKYQTCSTVRQCIFECEERIRKNLEEWRCRFCDKCCN